MQLLNSQSADRWQRRARHRRCAAHRALHAPAFLKRGASPVDRQQPQRGSIARFYQGARLGGGTCMARGAREGQR